MQVRCTWIHADGTPCGFVGEAGVSSHQYTCPSCGQRRKAPRNRSAQRELVVMRERNAILERALVNVWRWTNDGHPHLELLIPILRQTDEDYAALVALQELQDVQTADLRALVNG